MIHFYEKYVIHLQTRPESTRVHNTLVTFQIIMLLKTRKLHLQHLKRDEHQCIHTFIYRLHNLPCLILDCWTLACTKNTDTEKKLS